MTYWVAAEKDEAPELRGLGVQLGEYDDRLALFKQCLIDDRAIERLEKHWGERFVWGPEPVAGVTHDR